MVGLLFTTANCFGYLHAFFILQLLIAVKIYCIEAKKSRSRANNIFVSEFSILLFLWILHFWSEGYTCQMDDHNYNAYLCSNNNAKEFVCSQFECVISVLFLWTIFASFAQNSIFYGGRQIRFHWNVWIQSNWSDFWKILWKYLYELATECERREVCQQQLYLRKWKQRKNHFF